MAWLAEERQVTRWRPFGVNQRGASRVDATNTL
jgi:hypothetical protein